MGRGALARSRWKNDRTKKKKEREKRKAQAAHEARTASSSK